MASSAAPCLPRCWWCLATEDHRAYHDQEWGRPVTDDRRLFEKICLEGFQSGLSWITILRKRDNFRKAFKDFDLAVVARFGARDVQRLLKDAGIVRHRGKIESTINNAKRALELIRGTGIAGRLFLVVGARREDATQEHQTRRYPEHHRALDRLVERPQEARLDICGTDNLLRLHAGHGPGQRSRRRLLRAS